MKVDDRYTLALVNVASEFVKLHAYAQSDTSGYYMPKLEAAYDVLRKALYTLEMRGRVPEPSQDEMEPLARAASTFTVRHDEWRATPKTQRSPYQRHSMQQAQMALTALINENNITIATRRAV